MDQQVSINKVGRCHQAGVLGKRVQITVVTTKVPGPGSTQREAPFPRPREIRAPLLAVTGSGVPTNAAEELR
jgi:hypothetical protein